MGRVRVKWSCTISQIANMRSSDLTSEDHTSTNHPGRGLKISEGVPLHSSRPLFTYREKKIVGAPRMTHEPSPTNDEARNKIREVSKGALLCWFAILDHRLPRTG